MSRDFTKPAKSFVEQVQLLQSRGMIVDDVQESIFYLQHLNYYRLSAIASLISVKVRGDR